MAKFFIPMIGVFFCMIFNGCQPVEFYGSNKNIREIRVITSDQFAASELKEASLDYNHQYKNFSENLILKAKGPAEFNFKQLSRQKIQRNFMQGSIGDLIQEKFAIKTPDKLDLLLVIDNSSSMSPYQTRLASGLMPLLSHLGNTDWQMMVITTSPIRKPAPDGSIVKIFGCPRLNKSDPEDKALITKKEFEQNPNQAISRFQWKVSVGETGDPVERGLLAAVEGFTGECGDSTKSWIRADAHKAVLLLTDEENCGSDPDQNCDESLDNHPEFFKQNAPSGTQFFALLHDHELYSGTCKDEGYIRKPEDYRAVIAATGGLEGNICALSYDQILREISKNIHPVNKLAFTLKPVPDRSDIKVAIDGDPAGIPYEITENTLSFKAPLPQDSEDLTVSYRTRAIPTFQSLNIPPSLDLSTIEIKVNGTKLAPDRYSIESSKDDSSIIQTVYFKNQPPDLASIELSGYSLEIPLPQIFNISEQLPEDVLLDTLQVKVNDRSLENVSIDTEQKLLDLGMAPRDGEVIKVIFETPQSRQTDYPILGVNHDEMLHDVHIKDAETNQPVLGKIENKDLHIESHEVREGRKIIATYTASDISNDLNFTLPHEPVPQSLQFAGGPAGCIALHQISANSISFPCAGREVGGFKLKYQYWDEIKTEFPIPKSYRPNRSLRVTLNGVETSAYEIVEGNIRFPNSLLDQSSIIEIIVESFVSY
jgi:hypothetical protein